MNKIVQMDFPKIWPCVQSVFPCSSRKNSICNLCFHSHVQILQLLSETTVRKTWCDCQGTFSGFWSSSKAPQTKRTLVYSLRFRLWTKHLHANPKSVFDQCIVGLKCSERRSFAVDQRRQDGLLGSAEKWLSRSPANTNALFLQVPGEIWRNKRISIDW